MPTLTMKTSRSKNISITTNFSFACISLAYKRSKAPKGRILKCAKKCRSPYPTGSQRFKEGYYNIYIVFCQKSCWTNRIKFPVLALLHTHRGKESWNNAGWNILLEIISPKPLFKAELLLTLEQAAQGLIQPQFGKIRGEYSACSAGNFIHPWQIIQTI